MNKLVYAAIAAVTAVSAVPASAATTINLTPAFGALRGVFGNLNPSGTATDTYTFTVPTNGSVHSDVFSFGLKILATNLDFTSVTLNGAHFDIDSTGVAEWRSITLPVLSGLQTLKVEYANAQRFSSYAGVVSFTAGAVPEPATWALMILGFGAVAGSMRHRGRKIAVRYA